jgi:leucyl aminopeptidase
MSKPKLSFFRFITTSALAIFSCHAPGASATESEDASELRYVLSDRLLLQELGVEPLVTHEKTGTALARMTTTDRLKLAQKAHEHRRCGGHELVTEISGSATIGEAQEFARKIFQTFDSQLARDEKLRAKVGIGIPEIPAQIDPVIEAAVQSVSEKNLRDTVTFLSNFPSRAHKTADAARAITEFKNRINDTLKGTRIPFTIEMIAHKSTPMNSIRLTFPGATKPDEVIVAGGHIDSINTSYFGSKAAPGVDDNASGSANVLEAARIIAQGAQPARTIEFYWYAGEEGGLLGSNEIAQSAKRVGKNVIGVLQLDMTLFPGDGEFNLGSMTDFTSQDMRDLLGLINRNYIHATITEDKCGYGCSDHASWYKQGYPTLMPFEATMKKMNGNIHSERDTLSNNLSFRHSAMFSKIAVAFIMTLSAR